MNFEQLKIITTLGKEKSFSRTANRLNLTTSAVSQAVKNLENELTLELFNRSKGGTYPTESGQYVIREAYRILGIEDEIYAYAKNRERNIRKIVIGCIPGINYPIIKAIKKLQGKYEFLEISIIEEDTEHLLRMLKEKELNFAFLAFSDNIVNHNLHYKIKKVIDGELSFMVNKKSELAKKNILTYEDIIGEPIVIYKDKFLLNYISYIESKVGKRANLILKSNNLSSIINTVEENIAISPAPLYTLRNNFNGNLDKIKMMDVVEDNFVINLDLWFLEEKTSDNNQFGKEIFQLVKENIEKVLED